MKLNLGCGDEPEAGDDWINVDLLELPGVQVKHNLAFTPYPFPDAQFEFIKAIDVMEHLPNETPPQLKFDPWKVPYLTGGDPMLVEFIRECHRILQPGGTLHIQAVHYNSPNCWKDPTHVRGFDEVSMDYFDPKTQYGSLYGYYSEMQFDVRCEVTPWIDAKGVSHIGNCVYDMVKL